jgi:hypothetical protein
MVYSDYNKDPFKTDTDYLIRLARNTGYVPPCVVSKKRNNDECLQCEVNAGDFCETVGDSEIQSLLLYERDLYLNYRKVRQLRLEAIKRIHIKHNIDLSVSVLAQITFDKSPTLFQSAHAIEHMITKNPEEFLVENNIVLIEGYKYLHL